MTLTDFLLARIAEDEEAAAGVDRSRWQTGLGPPLRGDMYRHLSRHHPARVLAECEAKRSIVDRISGEMLHPYSEWTEVILCDLALPYADHPDYREEWKP